MKISIHLTVAALLGVSAASVIEVETTDGDRKVPKLIAFYESLIGRHLPDILLSRRHTRSSRSGVGYQLSPNDHIAGSPWPNGGSTARGWAHNYYPNFVWRAEDSIARRLKLRNEGHGVLASGVNPVGLDPDSSDYVIVKGRKSRLGSTPGGLPHSSYDSVGDSSLYSEKPRGGSLDGSVLPNDKFGGGQGLADIFGVGGLKFAPGYTSGGLPHSYNSAGEGQQSSEGFIARELNTRGGSTGKGLSPSDGSEAGGREHIPSHNLNDGSQAPVGLERKSRDGSTSGGVAHSDYFVDKGGESTDGLIAGGLVPSDYDLASNTYEIPIDAHYVSNETSEAGEMSPGMKEDIDKVRKAFMLAVSPDYVEMNNRKLWQALRRKQKQLDTLKLQLRHLLYIKREKLRKLHGIPWQYRKPSKALSISIIRDIENVIAYRPPHYNYNSP